MFSVRAPERRSFELSTAASAHYRKEEIAEESRILALDTRKFLSQLADCARRSSDL